MQRILVTPNLYILLTPADTIARTQKLFITPETEQNTHRQTLLLQNINKSHVIIYQTVPLLKTLSKI